MKMIMRKVNPNNISNLRQALISLCENDWDMNGNNGDEYTWEVALKNGYETSAEYLADESINIGWKCNYALPNRLDFAVGHFVGRWLGDDDYYADFEYETTIVNDDLAVICVAYTENN